jgi:hypothetical protein
MILDETSTTKANRRIAELMLPINDTKHQYEYTMYYQIFKGIEIAK